MSGTETKFWPVVGIVAFVALMLSGLGVTLVAIFFVIGAPHAIPPSPWTAAALFLSAAFLIGASIALLRRSIRALTVTQPPEKQKRTRRSLYAVAGGALLVVIGAIIFPRVYEPWWPAMGSSRHGDFMVEPTLLSACAPDAHRIFYKGHVVTKVASNIAFSPRNPARLLYRSACSHDGSESGTFYYSGGRGAPVQVNPLVMDEPGNWFDSFWSPDDKFVVVPALGHATLINLQTGESSKFLSDLFSVKDALSSSVGFLGWSPDGKKLALVVSTTYMRDDRSLFRESDLVAIDPETLTDTYVATMSKPDAWSTGQFIWVDNNGSYDLAVDSTLDNDPTIYRKTR
jgi:hypothetical protein